MSLLLNNQSKLFREAANFKRLVSILHARQIICHCMLFRVCDRIAPDISEPERYKTYKIKSRHFFFHWISGSRARARGLISNAVTQQRVHDRSPFTAVATSQCINQ